MGILQDLTYGAAKRWIAGKDMETALAKAKEANAKGLGTILNYLGEDVTDPKVAESHFEEYVKLQRAIGSAGIDGCVSVKLTQFGLGVLEDSVVYGKAEQLVEEAQGMGRMLWIDMEGSSVTTRTLQVYSKLLEGHKNVGVALQAYLRRSEDDLKNLMDIGGKVRLVKGAYREAARRRLPLAPGGHGELPQADEDALREGAGLRGRDARLEAHRGGREAPRV